MLVCFLTLLNNLMYTRLYLVFCSVLEDLKLSDTSLGKRPASTINLAQRASSSLNLSALAAQVGPIASTSDSKHCS